MKKIIILPALLIAAIAYSQISLGLKAGVNISNFTGGDFGTVEKEALVGFHGGGLVHIRLGHLVLQPELLFSSQGAKLTEAGQESNFKLSYLNIPVMLQYEANGGFYLEAGPQGGFKISESVPDSTIGDFAKGGDLHLDLVSGITVKSDSVSVADILLVSARSVISIRATSILISKTP